MEDYTAYGQEFIKFRQTRDFGKLLGAPFVFFKQEFKMLSKALLFYAGPFLLVALLGMSVFMTEIFNSAINKVDPFTGIFGYIALFMIFLMLGFSMANAVINNYVTSL